MSMCQYCCSPSADAVDVYRCEFFNSYKWNMYLFCLKCMGNSEKLDHYLRNLRLAVLKKKKRKNLSFKVQLKMLWNRFWK